MKIENVRVYDIYDTIIESGFPHSSNPEYSEERAYRLSKARVGSGHDCFLKGIQVRFHLTADHSFWLQFMRYHFADIVSSESKMHSITNSELKFHPLVYSSVISNVEEMIKNYNNYDDGGYMYFQTSSKTGAFEEIIMNCPIGLELKAGITTNYLQLKSIYNQRRTHKMSSWRQFCSWVETLPLAKKLITLE